MKSYEEIAASALERGREYEVRERAKRRTAGRVCFCSFAAVALIGAGVWQIGGPEGVDPVLPDPPAPPVSDVTDKETDQTPTEPSVPTETPVEPTGVPTEQSSAPTDSSDTNGGTGSLPIMDPDNGSGEELDFKMLISSYGGGAAACYSAPENRHVGFSIPLSGAMEEYGDTVLYNVRIDVFRNGELLDPASPEVKGIWEKLASRGLTACYEDYFDGQEHLYTLALHATIAEIQELTPPDGYGLFLFLKDEQ